MGAVTEALPAGFGCVSSGLDDEQVQATGQHVRFTRQWASPSPYIVNGPSEERVSVREPEDKNLDLQVERLVRAGCSLGNIRAEEASGARNDRGGLLELLDLVVEGDTLVVTHIDRLSRGLTHGLQVIEGLHRAGVEFRSLSEDFDTATATGKLQLTMVLAFSEWWRNSIRERSVAGQAKARAEGRFPGRRPSLNERQREYIRAERSKGVSQRDLAKRLEVSRWTIQQVDR